MGNMVHEQRPSFVSAQDITDMQRRLIERLTSRGHVLTQAMRSYELLGRQLMEAAQCLRECTTTEELTTMTARVLLEKLDMAMVWFCLPDTRGTLRAAALAGDGCDGVARGATCPTFVVRSGVPLVSADAVDHCNHCREFPSTITLPVFLGRGQTATLSMICHSDDKKISAERLAPFLVPLADQVGLLWRLRTMEKLWPGKGCNLPE